MDAQIAGRVARTLEPLHSMTYFAPETGEQLSRAGLEADGRMSYFAGRSAPMGAVGAGVVTAAFYNFSLDLVASAVPRAWELASPADVVAARFVAVDAALRRLLGDEVTTAPEVAEAAALARRATDGCAPEGRPLYAGHADLDWPTEQHLVLWHAVSLLREHRGDGHIIALQAAGLSGLDALLTHTASGTGFVPEFARTRRGWTREQWDAGIAGLTQRGLLDGGLTLTERGAAQRAEVEAQTHRLGLAPWEHLGADDTARLGAVGGELTRRILAAGCFPAGIFAGS